ncbi:MAG: ATP-dependent RecD-like DNA helicase, partial [Deltaproteobacteria bacterium]|nr:ATP-dependent RecD-like DNA helicase [Deltaproteobacteria bacterium]
GFTIARLNVSGNRDLVTVIGNLIAPTPGETLKMRGEWVNDPKYGEQFRVEEYKTVVPATVDGIRKYLGSGLIKGLGPVMAERIVKKFGKKTLDIIEDDMERLAEVDGVGKKRIAMIKTAWAEQREIRDVMLFLQSHDVSSGYATKIFKHYGNRAIAEVRKNPYRLATDIFGIGFLTADSIADKLGFAKDSRLRVEAGILYVLNQLTDEGHVFYPYAFLVEKSREILGVDRPAVVNAISVLSLNGTVVVEDLDESIPEFRKNNKAVYLETLYACETRIATLLKALSIAPAAPLVEAPEKAVAWVQQRLPITLAEKQVDAIKCALCEKVMVITGGPGTGKTTIINALLKIFARVEAKTLLAAPTGRAAKRMFETSGHEAKTIHRLLEFSFQKGGFQRNEKKPLACDVLVVDEASMIDTMLMHHLLKAVSREITLILVGDVDQLPSVGAGNVLRDVIASDAVSVVKLNEIFRQARESRIIVNAHKMIKGTMPSFDSADTDSDFYFIQQEDPEKVLDIILELIRKRIPRRFGFDPVDDIQVLTPMHKGIIGAENLNKRLQEALNPGRFGIPRGDREYRIADKVMQIKNNYDKDVFNGDIGRITEIRPEEQKVTISFDGRSIGYDYSDLDEIVTAYAISVHKSQGSEYPAVVIPILTQHFILLQRNLIYTAMTRGRKLVVMVGTRKALAIGVNNDKTQKRYTYLAHRLSG